MPLIKQNNYLVSCADNPELPLKFWFANFSIIYHQCVCGKSATFDGGKPGSHHENYKNHLKPYCIPLKMKADWDTYLDEVKRLVEADRARYETTWDQVK